MSIEKIIKKSESEEELTRKDWEWLTKEAEKCKDCKKPIKQSEDYCNYHQEVYRDMTSSVI